MFRQDRGVIKITGYGDLRPGALESERRRQDDCGEPEKLKTPAIGRDYFVLTIEFPESKNKNDSPGKLRFRIQCFPLSHKIQTVFQTAVYDPCMRKEWRGFASILLLLLFIYFYCFSFFNVY